MKRGEMSLRFGILTISDRSARGEREDASGPALEAVVKTQGWSVTSRETLPDELQVIEDRLVLWADSGDIDIILTTGGTGFSQRDVTPEATQAVVERPAPGLTEAMRMASLQVTSHAMLSRAFAGIRGRTLIVNLPGSPKGAIENFRVILPVMQHAVDLLSENPASEVGHQLI
jgi:molybdenum cofactor synthesis domain-containing protein